MQQPGSTHRASFAVMLLCAAVIGSPRATLAQQPTLIAAVELPSELDRVLRDYEAAWRARDAARLAALFHEDGFVLSPGSPPVRGRAAIARHYHNAGGPLQLRAVAYAADGTIGYIIGIFGASPTNEAGKFVLTLRRQDAQQPWLIAADMDNHNSR